jgi:hypothetical protein
VYGFESDAIKKKAYIAENPGTGHTLR